MELKELTSAFAAKLGIDGLAVQDGVCALEIDGIPLQITETAAGEALLATAVVGPPPRCWPPPRESAPAGQGFPPSFRRWKRRRAMPSSRPAAR